VRRKRWAWWRREWLVGGIEPVGLDARAVGAHEAEHPAGRGGADRGERDAAGDLAADHVELGSALIFDRAHDGGLDGADEQRAACGEAGGRQDRDGDGEPDAERADVGEPAPPAREGTEWITHRDPP
jgi:hypothetical protein